MKRTENICFPRSGHRLLQRLLSVYFEGEIKTNTIYGPNAKNMKHNLSLNYQKNHDFDLSTSIRDDRLYLIQIRYPLESLVSYFKLACQISGIPDTRKSWITFSRENMVYWEKFYKKWVENAPENSYVLSYRSLLEDTYKKLFEICFFLSDNNEVNGEKIKLVLQGQKDKIEHKNNFIEFKHYDEKFFDELRNMIKDIEGVDVVKDKLSI